MTRTNLFATAALPLFLMAGCGPMAVPMAARLDDEQQNRIDKGWENALAPIGKLDHQNWLDLFVVGGIYQFGVDKLYFRSEKQIRGGLAVMEIHFDRTKPADDRFEVAICDAFGNVLRRERYNREEVTQTYDDLLKHPTWNPETPEGAAKEAGRKKRIERIQELFSVVETSWR
jgi:hypothetical protein